MPAGAFEKQNFKHSAFLPKRDTFSFTPLRTTGNRRLKYQSLNTLTLYEDSLKPTKRDDKQVWHQRHHKMDHQNRQLALLASSNPFHERILLQVPI